MKSKKHIAVILLAAAILAANTVSVYADRVITYPDGLRITIYEPEDPTVSQPVTVTLDGTAVVFPDVQPYINEDDRTLVPIRFIAEGLGADVTWDDYTKTATIVKDDITIRYCPLSIGANYNGYEMDFDSKGVLKDDRTLVPLRFISEMLRCRVDWDAENEAVHITSPGEAVPFPEPRPSVHYRETEYDGNLMWITLDNFLDYRDCDNYEFQVEFINPVQFNTADADIGEIAGTEYQTYSRSIWRKLQPNSTMITWITDGSYATHADMQTFEPYDGMPLEYILRVKRLCSGEIREYTFTDTFRLLFPLFKRGQQ